MYATFFRSFGLHANPFNITPDPGYLYLNQESQATLDAMAGAVAARKGLIVLTGEPGTGKTTLINKLMQWLEEQKTPTAFIVNPHLELNELFDLIFARLGIPTGGRPDGNPWARLNRWLIDRFQEGRNAVVILDEAQGLPVSLLSEIRLLLNQETAREELMQLVLAGQPELEEKLKRPELRPVRQRVCLRCQTVPMKLEEAHEYVRRRLQVAGGISENVFSPEAIEAAYSYSRGIPRVMNLLCEGAMIRACMQQAQIVRASMVEEAAGQLQVDDVKPVRGRPNRELGLVLEPRPPLVAPAVVRARAAGPATGPRDLLPCATRPVQEFTGRKTLAPASDGVNMSHNRPSVSLDSSGSCVELGTGREPILEFTNKSEAVRKRQIESLLEKASRTYQTRQPRHWERRTAAVKASRTNNTGSALRSHGLRQALLKWGDELATALGSLHSTWTGRVRRRFPGLTELAGRKRYSGLTTRWLQQPLPNAQAHWISARWRGMLAPARSPQWKAKVESVVRWLEQPLVISKLHRKADR